MTTPKKNTQRRNDLRAQLARLGYEGGKRPAPPIAKQDLKRALRKHSPGVVSPPARSVPEIVDPPTLAGKSIVYRRDLPPAQQHRARARAMHGVPLPLEDAVAGEEFTCPGHGRLYRVCQTVAEIDGAEGLAATFSDMLTDAHSPVAASMMRHCDPGPLTAEDIIFMDVESTGLSSSPLFLIGVMVWDGSDFVVEQYFARNYAEEAAVIASYLDVARPRSLLVTFNGKSFDVPFIRARCAATGLRYNLSPAHLDLLHESRRIWKHTLPNCKLQTLEHHVCGRLRVGDIPGSEIPEAYHAYVRTQDAREMAEAIKHNMLDLVTLADLMTRFPTA